MSAGPGHVAFERDAHVHEFIEDPHCAVGADRRLEHDRVKQIPLVRGGDRRPMALAGAREALLFDRFQGFPHYGAADVE